MRMPLDCWLHFIHKVIKHYGAGLDTVQTTNEPNLTSMDGSKSYVFEALVQGVLTAKEAAAEDKINLNIGFGSVPDGPKTIPLFWEKLAALGGKSFIQAVDYVGHNFYVDVFEEPVDIAEIPTIVERTLRKLRRNLKNLRIPTSVPI